MATSAKPTNTRDSAGVGNGVGAFLPMIAAIAEQLTALMLWPRDETLKHKASRSEYVNQLRRDVRGERAKPWFMITAISFADVDDPAVPLEQVTEPYRRAIELLTQRRQEVELIGPDAPSLLGVIQAESSKEDAENRAERRVLAEPDNPEAIEELLRASAAEIAAQNRRDNAARARLVALQTRAIRPRVTTSP